MLDLIPERQRRDCRSARQVLVIVNRLQVDEAVAAAAQLPNVDDTGIVARRQNLPSAKHETWQPRQPDRPSAQVVSPLGRRTTQSCGKSSAASGLVESEKNTENAICTQQASTEEDDNYRDGGIWGVKGSVPLLF